MHCSVFQSAQYRQLTVKLKPFDLISVRIFSERKVQGLLIKGPHYLLEKHLFETLSEKLVERGMH